MSARALTAALVLLVTFSVFAQDQTAAQSEAQKVLESIDWVHGPAKGEMKDIASIDVPQGYMFAKANDVPKLMELMENPVSGQEVGFIAPEGMEWFMVFEFDSIGYVEDSDRDKLDAGAILTSVREGTEAANEERKKRGWGTLDIVGWEQEPKYDPKTNNLIWAIRAKSAEGEVVNFNTRILGREGVMKVALVCDPPQLAAVTPMAQNLLGDYSFNPGKRYAEFAKGDKVAKVGLAALIAGGGVAVAAKTGLLQKLWKVLVAVAIAIAAVLKKLFGKKEESTVPHG